MEKEKRDYRIIATEEAFVTKEIVEYYKRMNAYNPAPYSISVLEELDASQEDKKKMFETNAVKLFNINC